MVGRNSRVGTNAGKRFKLEQPARYAFLALAAGALQVAILESSRPSSSAVQPLLPPVGSSETVLHTCAPSAAAADSCSGARSVSLAQSGPLSRELASAEVSSSTAARAVR